MKTKSATRPATLGPRDDGFRLEDFMPYRLSVAASRVSRLMARHYMEDCGLGIPEWRVLSMVGRFGTLSPSIVGERTAMDKVKVSRAAASLVARGMLTQTQDPSDGRGRLLRLTRKGVGVYQRLVPLARDLETQLADGFSRAEWAALLKALDKLNEQVLAVEGDVYADAAD